MIIDELKKKYKKRLEESPCPRSENDFNPTLFLFQKWAYKVPKGWYGCDLSNAPFLWALIIDDFLEYLNKKCPDFEIHQIKLKMGGLRFHVDYGYFKDDADSQQIYNEIDELENWLYDERLVY